MLIKKNRLPIRQIATIGILPSFMKKAYYRLKGYKIGKHVKLGIGSVIIGKDVEVGDHSKTGFFTVIRASKIKIGRYVSIGATSMIDTERFEIDDDSKISEQVFVGGLKTPQSALILGKRTIIMQMSFINPTLPITIGDDTGIGGHCLLFTHGSWLSELEGFPVSFAPITLGKKVWLPWRVFIMPGVEVGDNVVIGANSLVNKNLPSNSLAAGSPAKIVKEDVFSPLSENEKQGKIDGYLNEFAALMRHFNIDTDVQTNDNGKTLILTNKNTKSRIDWITATSITTGEANIPEDPADNTLIVHDKNSYLHLYSNKKYKMILFMDTYERIGSSDGGEELVSFISRYGIRFDRLD